MNIISSYQNNVLVRQCGVAVRNKEIDQKSRIKNKEEYHQPGDVDTNEDSGTNNDSENDTTIEQRRITECFLKNIRKECEHQNTVERIETTEESNFSK